MNLNVVYSGTIFTNIKKYFKNNKIKNNTYNQGSSEKMFLSISKLNDSRTPTNWSRLGPNLIQVTIFLEQHFQDICYFTNKR